MPPKAIAIIVQYRAEQWIAAILHCTVGMVAGVGRAGVGRALLLVLTEVRYEKMEWTGVT